MTVQVDNVRQQQAHTKAQMQQGSHQAEPSTVGNAIGLMHIIKGKPMPPIAPTTAHRRGGLRAAAPRLSLTTNGATTKEQHHRPTEALPQLPALNYFVNSGASQPNGRGTRRTMGAKRYRMLKIEPWDQVTIKLGECRLIIILITLDTPYSMFGITTALVSSPLRARTAHAVRRRSNSRMAPFGNSHHPRRARARGRRSRGMAGERWIVSRRTKKWHAVCNVGRRQATTAEMETCIAYGKRGGSPLSSRAGPPAASLPVPRRRKKRNVVLIVT